ncbi:adenylate/guanylate cyclase domain-containing protein [Thermodesulfobacteriota bacterium]
MKTEYRDYDSFFGKMQISIIMSTIIPYLLIIYLFITEKIAFTQTIILFSPLILFSTLTGFSVIRRSASQLGNLAQTMRRYKLGEVIEPVRIKSDRELSDIAESFNNTLKDLNDVQRKIKEQSAQLITYSRDLSVSFQRIKAEEELRKRLSRYVRKDLVDKLVKSEKGTFPENDRKEVTVLYADIRSFSSLSESMPAEEVVCMLNEFFRAMVDIIFRNNGILDKFVGDQIMAVFGIISLENDARLNAVKAAIEMQDATEELMKIRAKRGKETFEIGIGINTGNAIVGNVGSENRMDYTVIGDSVNVAAKLQHEAKGGEIIIGEKTYRQTKGHFCIQKKSKIYLKNKIQPVLFYNLLRRNRKIRKYG